MAFSLQKIQYLKKKTKEKLEKNRRSNFQFSRWQLYSFFLASREITQLKEKHVREFEKNEKKKLEAPFADLKKKKIQIVVNI